MVVQNHHKRLTERVSGAGERQGVTVEPKDLIREVAILADRATSARRSSGFVPT